LRVAFGAGAVHNWFTFVKELGAATLAGPGV
jgi:hypothetical protein